MRCHDALPPRAPPPASSRYLLRSDLDSGGTAMKRDVFTAEHDAFRREVAEFVAKEVVPNLQRWETQGIVDRSFYERAGAAGLLGLGLEERFGGRAVPDFRYNAVVSEELCRV